jgi:hypothetical protein
VLGLVVIASINAFGPPLTASSTTGGFGLLGVEQAAQTASLTAPAEAGILLAGFGLALLGGLLAGTAASAGEPRACDPRGIQTFQRVLTEIGNRPDVSDVAVQIDEVIEGEWPYATSAPGSAAGMRRPALRASPRGIAS